MSLKCRTVLTVFSTLQLTDINFNIVSIIVFNTDTTAIVIFK